MSFDLDVWHGERSITVEEAGDLYLKLCKQEWVPIEESPAVEAFYRELCGKYQEIDPGGHARRRLAQTDVALVRLPCDQPA